MASWHSGVLIDGPGLSVAFSQTSYLVEKPHSVQAITASQASGMQHLLRSCTVTRKRFNTRNNLHFARLLSIGSQDLLSQLINYEQIGIPKGAGTAGGDAAFDLNRMHRLLAELGDPHKALRAIHIAGSKGKGSTATLTASILQSSGHRVGLYTSPHLHHLGERIQIDGTPLPEADLHALLERYRHAISSAQEAEKGRLSHFEVTTALAFRHFVDQQVDVGVIETGMGGTTDATNVIPPESLAAAVITSLGYEHVEALGGTIESIAAAKAGIIKPGRPVVVARQQYPPALQVLEREAVRQDAALLHAGQHVSVKHEGYAIAGHPSSQVLREQVRLSFPADQASAAGAGHTPLQPPQAPLSLSTCLVGAHQHDNLAAATATCLVLRQQGWPISDGALASGLAAARLPGRMQVLHLPASSGVSSSQDVSSTSDAGHQLLVLDGAHSPESATALAQVLRSAFPIQPIVLVVAMASDKDTRGVLGALRACHPSAVVFTTVPIAGSQHRSAAPGLLQAHWQAAALSLAPLSPSSSSPAPRPPRCRELIQASLKSAYERAKHELQGALGASNQASGGVLVVTGSLHAVAAAQQLEEVAQGLAQGRHYEQQQQQGSLW